MHVSLFKMTLLKLIAADQARRRKRFEEEGTGDTASTGSERSDKANATSYGANKELDREAASLCQWIDLPSTNGFTLSLVTGCASLN